MTRISISLPDEILNEFDETLKQQGYNSRNEGLQIAMHEYIERNK